jgi:hypothetical protein
MEMLPVFTTAGSSEPRVSTAIEENISSVFRPTSPPCAAIQMRTSTPVTASQLVTTQTERCPHTYWKRRIVRYNLDGKEIEDIEEEWQE